MLAARASRVTAMPERNDKMVWIDCEMTGLDLGHDALVEVAALVTDSELNVLGDGVDVVIKPPQEALDTMPEVVRDMHTSSGLLTELAAGMTLAEAEAQVLAYVRETCRSRARPRSRATRCTSTAASSTATCATLDEHLHYRLVDVSSIKELVRRWFPRVYFNSPAKHGGHRALADIQESIEELKYYRQAIFVPQPGPDTDAAKALAAQFVLGQAG